MPNAYLLTIEQNKYRFNIYLKDESSNPTGSFKDRGMPLMLSDAKMLGKKRIAIPSTGNAALSLGYYANKADIESTVFVPSDTHVKKLKLLEKNSHVIKCKDLIESYESFYRFCQENSDVYNALPGTNVPYSQGLKTLAYEVFEQCNNFFPDWIIMPCASGGNIVAQYEGFSDLYQMGLIKKMPKFVTVQILGGDPITIGFKKKQNDSVVIIENIVESKSILSSDTNFNYFKIMRILEKTEGLAISVSDAEIDITISQNDFPDLDYSSMSVFTALGLLDKVIKQNENVILIGTAKKHDMSVDY